MSAWRQLVGIFNALRDLFAPEEIVVNTTRRSGGGAKKSGRTSRRCKVEELESRRLMSATSNNPHVVLGAVYFEEDSGDDNQPDTIDVQFKGGAPGTTLDTLTINGDKRLDGLTDGDIFFDTEAGGLGSYQSQPLKIVSHDGFQVLSATVSDGGTLITFHFSGFHAGDKLEFTVDADEAQYVDTQGVDSNSIVEGGEFQRSIMTGQFSAEGYVDLTLKGLFWDEFDPNFAATASSTGVTLDLPNDQYDPTHDYTDRTAGAIADDAQIPLATISGYVYHDADNNGIFDHTNEHAIGGVTLELLDANGNGTGITTTTSTNPANLGFYEFRDLTPGQYGVREVQPNGWLDGKDTAGDHGGTADPETNGRVDKIIGA
ncbi:MAG TPA: SdrD B-like domain-containing protein, partial [Lacipirellulaceae bacterium]|nr:SdrD B-like domain-containing protein [Lacipirellulaceae bacterium]